MKMDTSEMREIVESNDLGKIFSILKEKKNVSDSSGNTFLMHAVAIGTLSMIDALITTGMNVHQTNNSGLDLVDIAWLNNRPDIVRHLLTKGFSVHKKDKSFGYRRLLYYSQSVEKGVKSEILNILIEFGADVQEKDKNGRTALHHASYKGAVTAVEALLQAGASIHVTDRNGWTPIGLASFMCHSDVVKLLISKGAIATERFKEGDTLLHAAAHSNINNISDTIKELVRAGAEVNAKNDQLKIPLILAVERNEQPFEAVKALVESGSLIDEKDNDDMSALQYLMKEMNGRYKTFEYLVNAGADIDSVYNGNSVLMIAVWHGLDRVVKTLLENGANPNHTNKEGKSALTYVIERGFYKYVPLFEAKMSKLDAVQKELLQQCKEKAS